MTDRLIAALAYLGLAIFAGEALAPYFDHRLAELVAYHWEAIQR